MKRIEKIPLSPSRFLQWAFVALLCGAGAVSAQVVAPGFAPSVNGAVHAVLVTPDGKLLVGGEFSNVNGQPRSKLARLHADGTLDAGFVPPLFDDPVRSLALAPDGRILVGGEFKHANEGDHPYVVRLHEDGSLDTSFISAIDSFIGEVTALAVQANGDVLAGGRFRIELDETYEYLVRLKAADGSLDTGFFPQLGDKVEVIVLQPGGGILVGGYIDPPSEEAVPPRYGILRLTSGGSIDESFELLVKSRVYAIALQPDGRILIGGSFGYIDDLLRSQFARLSANGALDTSLIDAGMRYGWLRQITPAADGRIVVAGTFSWFPSEQAAWRIALVKANGERDLGFNEILANGSVLSTAMLPGGRIVVGGYFSQPRPYLFAIDTQDPTAVDELDVNGTTVTWWRSGLVPALLEAPILEHSPDGVNWTAVGPMTQFEHGWRFVGYVPSARAAGQYLRVVATLAGGGTIQMNWEPRDRIFRSGFELR